MRHPPYHLRPNKAIDRSTLVEAIDRVLASNPGVKYTYHGFGGPYLDDFRLLYESFPLLDLVSIERDIETSKRQAFHRPSSTVKLILGDFDGFLATYDPKDQRSIFWLDYTNMEPGNFDDFVELLGRVAVESMVKISLRIRPKDYDGFPGLFAKKFAKYVSSPSFEPAATSNVFARDVQDMLRLAGEKALTSFPTVFQPVCSFHYADGVDMLTLTGVICEKVRVPAIKAIFQDWELANLDWSSPTLIDVPMLSTKERLRLESVLPFVGNSGERLRSELGYLIDRGVEETDSKLGQYAQYHRRLPHFLRATP